MKTEEFKSWEEFWDCYKSLQWYFMESKKQAIVDYMEEIPKYVNGLTDGWIEFKIRFNSLEKMWGSQLIGEPGVSYLRIKKYLEARFKI